jgi:hypothetical protein
LGTKYLVVLCAGSALQLAKQSLDEAPYKLSGAVVKLAGITFFSLAFSYWIDNLGFLLREKLAAIFIKPSLGVSQLAGHLLHQLHANKFFGTIHHRAINSNQYSSSKVPSEANQKFRLRVAERPCWSRRGRELEPPVKEIGRIAGG